MKLFGGKIFCKHDWEFSYKAYSGNEKVGHKESEYGFRCMWCEKVKIVKVGKKKC